MLRKIYCILKILLPFLCVFPLLLEDYSSRSTTLIFSFSHQLSTDQCTCMKKSPKAEKRSPPGAYKGQGIICAPNSRSENPLSDGEHKRVLSQFFFLFLSLSVVSNSLWPHGLYSPWNSPGQNTGVGSSSLLPYQPRDWTQVSCIAGGFFTSWDTTEVE